MMSFNSFLIKEISGKKENKQTKGIGNTMAYISNGCMHIEGVTYSELNYLGIENFVELNCDYENPLILSSE